MIDFKKIKINFDKISKYLFVYSLCFLMYGFGFITYKNQLYPFYKLNYVYAQIKNTLTGSRSHYLFPIRYKESGVKIRNREKIMPGVTLLTSFWTETEWTEGIHLIDIKGKILREVKAKDIWPQSPHIDHLKNLKNSNENYVYGT